MNTYQRVKRQDIEPDGSTLTLFCGHRIWIAGFIQPLVEYPCLISPCYQPEKAMGKGQ